MDSCINKQHIFKTNFTKEEENTEDFTNINAGIKREIADGMGFW